jgi:hypothetical protein
MATVTLTVSIDYNTEVTTAGDIVDAVDNALTDHCLWKDGHLRVLGIRPVDVSDVKID